MAAAALQQSQCSCDNCVAFVCLQVLQDLHAEHTTVTLDEQGSLVGVAPATDLAKPLQEQCRRVALTCNELLRHFWACLPLTTQPRRDKAARLDRALQAQYDRCVQQAADSGAGNVCEQQCWHGSSMPMQAVHFSCT